MKYNGRRERKQNVMESYRTGLTPRVYTSIEVNRKEIEKSKEAFELRESQPRRIKRNGILI